MTYKNFLVILGYPAPSPACKINSPWLSGETERHLFVKKCRLTKKLSIKAVVYK